MHRSARIASSLLFVLMALLILLPATVPALGPPDIGEPNPMVMDPMLRDRVEEVPPGERIDLVVRFDGDVERADREHAS